MFQRLKFQAQDSLIVRRILKLFRVAPSQKALERALRLAFNCPSARSRSRVILGSKEGFIGSDFYLCVDTSRPLVVSERLDELETPVFESFYVKDEAIIERCNSASKKEQSAFINQEKRLITQLQPCLS